MTLGQQVTWLPKPADAERVSGVSNILTDSLLFGMTDDLFQRQQGIQNVAVRLVTGTGRREHITPVLCWLYWLPVRC